VRGVDYSRAEPETPTPVRECEESVSSGEKIRRATGERGNRSSEVWREFEGLEKLEDSHSRPSDGGKKRGDHRAFICVERQKGLYTGWL